MRQYMDPFVPIVPVFRDIAPEGHHLNTYTGLYSSYPYLYLLL